MVEPHLAHRLPWNSFAEVYTNAPLDRGYYEKDEYVQQHRKRIDHFARCLASALNEFAATDKSSDDERVDFDPYRSWRAESYFYGAYMGYKSSIIYGYLELNMILTDMKKLPPVIMKGPELKRTWTMDVLCGACDGGHPMWLADHIRPIFDEQKRLVPLTADVCQRIRDHCALLFRCMHSLSVDNDFLDAEALGKLVQGYIRW